MQPGKSSSTDFYAEIVGELNRRFGKGLTLVTFDEIEGPNLLTLLNEVLTSLDSEYKVDLKTEQKDIAVLRMMEFLKLLKFKSSFQENDWKQGLIDGAKSCIYPPLHYILTNFEALKKRAFIGRYMQKIDIPSEYMTDGMIQDDLKQQSELQKQFVEVHKQLDNFKSDIRNPSDLRREIESLMEEKKQLVGRIDTMESRSKSMEGFAPIFEATHNLRLEQEEESMNMERAQKQKMEYERSLEIRNESEMRLSEMKAVRSSASTAQEMLKIVQNEVERFRAQALKTLPEEIESANKQLQELKAKANVQHTRDQINYMKDECMMTEREVQQMKQRLSSLTSDPLDSWKKQYRVQLKKLEDKLQDVDDEEAEKVKLEGELSKHRSAYEYKQKFENYRKLLLKLTNEFKALKEELTQIQSETVILERTSRILQNRDSNYEDYLNQLERKQGITGAREMKGNLEKVSALKSNVDIDKENILVEMSKKIEQIKVQVESRKVEITPIVNKIKQLRDEYNTLEEEHKTKGLNYRMIALGFESERQGLEEQCAKLQDECMKEESQYHQLQQQYLLMKNLNEKADFEKKYLSGSHQLSAEFRTYSSIYNNKVQQQELLAKQLRKRQKEIKENESESLKQKMLFTNLFQLLKFKKESQDSSKNDLLKETTDTFNRVQYEGADVMILDEN